MQPKPTPRQLGRYRLSRKLGAGGMAEVFLAVDADPARPPVEVVVKRLLPHLAKDAEFVRMFLHEASLAVRLAHPNVVRVLDLGESDGDFFIAMEYVDGASAHALKRRALAAPESPPHTVWVKIVADACDGLAYAHEFADGGGPLGIVHRDISPDNLAVSRRGEVKVLDFGIAKAANLGPRTQTGIVKGKVPFMSPEQLCGEALDPRSDIFSLGVTLYELLTGRRPFDAPTDLATAQAILLQPPAPLDDPPSGLADLAPIVERALQKDREQRFASCRLMSAELRRYLQAHPPPVDAAALARIVCALLDPDRTAEHPLADTTAPDEPTAPPTPAPDARTLPPSHPPALPPLPVGRWTGYYRLAGVARDTFVRMDLALADGELTGSGREEYGAFRVEGACDGKTLEWTATFDSGRREHFRGAWGGETVRGSWRRASKEGGGTFELWPASAPDAPRRAPRLFVVFGNGRGEQVQQLLDAKRPILVGSDALPPDRAGALALRLRGAGIAARHAELSLVDGRAVIRRLEGPVSVNGVELGPKPRFLGPEDRATLGDFSASLLVDDWT